MIDKLAHDIARAAQIKLAALNPHTADVLKTMGIGGVLGGAAGALGHRLLTSEDEGRWYTPAILRSAAVGALGGLASKYALPGSNLAAGLTSAWLGLGEGAESPNQKEWNFKLDQEADELNKLKADYQDDPDTLAAIDAYVNGLADQKFKI